VPIKRKGTKYVARALHAHTTSVPAVLAIRDMLNLARTAKEVKEMIKDKAVKINNRIITDYRDSIQIFNVLSVNAKNFVLGLSETTGKFEFKDIKDANKRICQIIGKVILPGKKIQINLHDGTNFIGKNDMKVNDTVILDSSGKLLKHIPSVQAKEITIMSGKYIGKHGTVKAVSGKNVTISLKEGAVVIPIRNVIANG